MKHVFKISDEVICIKTNPYKYIWMRPDFFNTILEVKELLSGSRMIVIKKGNPKFEQINRVEAFSPVTRLIKVLYS